MSFKYYTAVTLTHIDYFRRSVVWPVDQSESPRYVIAYIIIYKYPN